LSAVAADETELAGGKDPVSSRVAVRWLRMVSSAGADAPTPPLRSKTGLFSVRPEVGSR
jgi:hypothetical protein